MAREAWVWREAVRRGDDHLFAPIVEIDDSGWSVMAYGYPMRDFHYTALPLEPADKPVPRDVASHLKEYARSRGWIPYDTEVRGISERPVLIDYEGAYSIDMVNGLYMHSFPYFPEHDLYNEGDIRIAENRFSLPSGFRYRR